jgi:hypothetical protein
MNKVSPADEYQKQKSFSPGYFLFFVISVIRAAWFIIRSRKKETTRAFKILATIERDFKGQFNPKTRRKIAVSYGIYNPMMMDAFAKLHGKYTSEKEKVLLVHYFICSSLFDDFTDCHLITAQQLESISFNPENYQAETFDEKAFRYSHLLLKGAVKNMPAYEQTSQELFTAQNESLQQYQSTLTNEEIKQITLRKGGNAVLLCSYYLDRNTSTEEQNCWYRIGGIIQLTNDLFDTWKDIQEEIATYPNRMRDVKNFERFFLDQIGEMKKSILSLPASSKQKKIFSLYMAGIYSFGLIAIDQLKRIQGSQPELPDLSSLSRKALIIDMEKTSNILRWFRFTYRHARLF